ncbi:MAG: hypothetical protein KGN01_08135 [Patescibacteria group bacterium]|nr:hypothetical protein [Patescibacteria group bacterium]
MGKDTKMNIYIATDFEHERFSIATSYKNKVIPLWYSKIFTNDYDYKKTPETLLLSAASKSLFVISKIEQQSNYANPFHIISDDPNLDSSMVNTLSKNEARLKIDSAVVYSFGGPNLAKPYLEGTRFLKWQEGVKNLLFELSDEIQPEIIEDEPF